ncbi:MAG: tRNA (adenosine(37)-N6)-threonylcarbamoyltransferase complex dimerization subunit type 1 TsaB [Phycisphaerae bacterium]
MSTRSPCFQLALETSSQHGSIALGRAGVVAEARAFGAPRDHSASLMAAVDTLCRDHEVAPGDLASIFVSIGPGSFTGLRIGLVVGRMLALGLGATVHGVPTMDVIALNTLSMPDPPTRAAVLIDAGRRRVFAADYQRSGSEFMAGAQPVEVAAEVFLRDLSKECVVICTPALADQVRQTDPSRSVLPEAMAIPRAEVVLTLGHERSRVGPVPPARELVPLYIRQPGAVEKWAQRHT